MRKKNFKGRCEKRIVPKVEGICATYDIGPVLLMELSKLGKWRTNNPPLSFFITNQHLIFCKTVYRIVSLLISL